MLGTPRPISRLARRCQAAPPASAASRGDGAPRPKVFPGMRRHFTHVLRIVVIPAVVLAGAGCSALGLDGGTNERARLRAARVKWEQHGIPAYRFIYRRSCFCPDEAPLVIEVQNSAVI